MWQAGFSCTQFLPYLPEECQGNPGVYGFELAHWLSQALVKQGAVTSYPYGDDWGWFIEYLDGETEIMVGCSSEAQRGEGYKGESIKWRVFINPQLSIRQQLEGMSTESVIQHLASAITDSLAAEGIAVVPE